MASTYRAAGFFCGLREKMLKKLALSVKKAIEGKCKHIRPLKYLKSP